MNLAGQFERRTLRVTLPPWADGVRVRGRAPFVTPWRTIQLADRAEDLAPSVLTLKLNPPSRIADATPYRPMKYVGIWWGAPERQHVGRGATHGATTANTRRYIDFAAANGMGGVLVEGWNEGWNGDWMANRNGFSFTKAYPDYDLPGLAVYAKSKGVTLIGHNETAMGIENYERQLDSAFALDQRLGIRAIKTGYVNDKTLEGHAHTGQYMVRHFRKVVETAALRIGVDVHEPIKDTGERRTWPNMMSREGARGQEYNAWGGEGGNPPEHETILFFTRMVSGPMDFTPEDLRSHDQASVGTAARTRGRARERRWRSSSRCTSCSTRRCRWRPTSSRTMRDSRHFSSSATSPWIGIRRAFCQGRIGDYVAVARKAKGKDEWFVGAITDEEARTLDVSLTFLRAGGRYVAEIYADGPRASWRDNPVDCDLVAPRHLGDAPEPRAGPGWRSGHPNPETSMRSSIPPMTVALAILACTTADKNATADSPAAAATRAAATMPSTDPAFHPEWSRTAVIYEVNVRQYTPEGTFTALQTHLPRLKALGVDVLWLMPVQPIGVKNRKGKLGSYYAISDYTAINAQYGSEAAFKAFVDAAHQQGLRVILDWVANHTAHDHEWVTARPAYHERRADGRSSTHATTRARRPTGPTSRSWTTRTPSYVAPMIDEMRWWVDRLGSMASGATWRAACRWISGSRLEPLKAVRPDLFLLAEAESPEMHAAFDMTYGWEAPSSAQRDRTGEGQHGVARSVLREAGQGVRSRRLSHVLHEQPRRKQLAGLEFERMGANHIPRSCSAPPCRARCPCSTQARKWACGSDCASSRRTPWTGMGPRSRVSTSRCSSSSISSFGERAVGRGTDGKRTVARACTRSPERRTTTPCSSR